MTYPPTPPPNSRTDATPLPTNHIGDHNDISNALTDIINELGTGPKGAAADVTARLANLPGAIVFASAAFSAGTGVEIVGYDGGATFTAAPIVLANVDITTTGDVTWFISDRNTTGFGIRIYLNGSLYTGGGGSIQYAAFGTLV